MCSFGWCQTRFEFLSQFRKVRNAFECFITQVQTRLPKTKCVWPMKINVICTVYATVWAIIRFKWVEYSASVVYGIFKPPFWGLIQHFLSFFFKSKLHLFYPNFHRPKGFDLLFHGTSSFTQIWTSTSSTSRRDTCMSQWKWPYIDIPLSYRVRITLYGRVYFSYQEIVKRLKLSCAILICWI